MTTTPSRQRLQEEIEAYGFTPGSGRRMAEFALLLVLMGLPVAALIVLGCSAVR